MGLTRFREIIIRIQAVPPCRFGKVLPVYELGIHPEFFEIVPGGVVGAESHAGGDSL